MSLVVYTTPFIYTHLINRKGFIEGIAYALEYYVPLFLMVFLFSDNSSDIVLLCLSLTAFMSIYEIGYFENNVIAINYEKHPTIRHTKLELLYLEKNLKKIFYIRYFIALFLVAVMSLFESTWNFIGLLILTRIVFYFYNLRYRFGLGNRLLFVLLRLLRYVTPIYFLGIVTLMFALPVAMVNLINNYAWYNRTNIHLPRFFGTKLFDACMYGLFYFIFKTLNYDSIASVFLYLTTIKIVLFLIVLVKMRGKKNV